MAKRRFNGSLTGGTGDVNPQWFCMGAGAASNAATWAEASQTIPRESFGEGGSSRLIMEILKVQFILTGTTTFAIGADGNTRFYLSTTSWGTAEPTLIQQTGRVICKRRLDWSFGTDVATACTVETEPIIDLTDGTGHGILVAGDTLYVGVIGVASAGLSGGNVSARLLYRWKRVGITEWIGMVESQK